MEIVWLERNDAARPRQNPRRFADLCNRDRANGAQLLCQDHVWIDLLQQLFIDAVETVTRMVMFADNRMNFFAAQSSRKDACRHNRLCPGLVGVVAFMG